MHGQALGGPDGFSSFAQAGLGFGGFTRGRQTLDQGGYFIPQRRKQVMLRQSFRRGSLAGAQRTHPLRCSHQRSHDLPADNEHGSHGNQQGFDQQPEKTMPPQVHSSRLDVIRVLHNHQSAGKIFSCIHGQHVDVQIG